MFYIHPNTSWDSQHRSVSSGCIFPGTGFENFPPQGPISVPHPSRSIFLKSRSHSCFYAVLSSSSSSHIYTLPGTHIVPSRPVMSWVLSISRDVPPPSRPVPAFSNHLTMWLSQQSAQFGNWVSKVEDAWQEVDEISTCATSCPSQGWFFRGNSTCLASAWLPQYNSLFKVRFGAAGPVCMFAEKALPDLPIIFLACSWQSWELWKGCPQLFYCW